jgi:hypothetical protein
MTLHTYFPQAFVTKFGERADFGMSTLLEDTFDMALEIRTQLAIIALSHDKEREDWYPDQTLTQIFYEPPAQRHPLLSCYGDAVKNACLKDIMRILPNTKDQAKKISERATLIHSTFRNNNDRVKVDDLVDFKRLEMFFPWSKFLVSLVQWSRSRFIEIADCITQQGGLNDITKSLLQVAQTIKSQVKIKQNPTASVAQPRQVLVAAKIVWAPNQRYVLIYPIWLLSRIADREFLRICW